MSGKNHKLTCLSYNSGASGEVPTRTDRETGAGSGEPEGADEDGYVGEYQQRGEETEGCGWDGGSEELELRERVGWVGGMEG